MSAQEGRMASLRGSYHQCAQVQEDEDQVVLDLVEGEGGEGGGCRGEAEGRRGRWEE